MSSPNIKPIELKEYTCKQSHYGDIVPKLPMRSMLVAPSGAGKTVLLTNMILYIYKGCVSRVCIWSPIIEVDNTWKPVKDYIRDHFKPNDREKIYFDSYDPSELEQVINTQQNVTNYQKNKNIKGYTKYWLALMILQISPVSHESFNYYISYIHEEGIT